MSKNKNVGKNNKIEEEDDDSLDDEPIPRKKLKTNIETTSKSDEKSGKKGEQDKKGTAKALPRKETRSSHADRKVEQSLPKNKSKERERSPERKVSHKADKKKEVSKEPQGKSHGKSHASEKSQDKSNKNQNSDKKSGKQDNGKAKEVPKKPQVKNKKAEKAKMKELASHRKLDVMFEAAKMEKKQKAKEQSEKEKQMAEFTRKYPQYVTRGKIKFPIEDKLFSVYGTLLEEYLPKVEKPKLKSGFIPPKALGDILQIWDFFISFPELFKIEDIEKEEIYASLTYDGDEFLGLVNDMHQGVLSLYLAEFIKKFRFDTYKDETENPFFVLVKHYVGNTTQNGDELALIWTEFARKVMNVQPYSDFISETTKRHFETLAQKTCVFYNKLPYKTKIKILISLIDGIYETDVFRDFLQSKVENTSLLVKERNDLQQEIKQDEIEHQNLKNKVAQMKKGLKKGGKGGIYPTRLDSLRRPRNVESTSNKDFQRYSDELTILEDLMDKKQERLDDINSELVLTLQTATYIGADGNKSEYWVFQAEPDKVYVRNPSFIEVDEEWFYYDTRAEIDQLIDSLNTKGVREKKLADNLEELSRSGRIFFDEDEEVSDAEEEEEKKNGKGGSAKKKGKQEVQKPQNGKQKEEREEEKKENPDSMEEEEEDDYVVRRKDTLEAKKSQGKGEENKIEEEKQDQEEKENKEEDNKMELEDEDKKTPDEEEKAIAEEEERRKEQHRLKEIEKQKEKEREREEREKRRLKKQIEATEGLKFSYWFAKVIEYQNAHDEIPEPLPAPEVTVKKTTPIPFAPQQPLYLGKKRSPKELTFENIRNVIIKTEAALTTYLEKWEARWAHPSIRQELMTKVHEAQNIEDLRPVLLALNEYFQYSETPRRKRGRPVRVKEEEKGSEGEKEEEDELGEGDEEKSDDEADGEIEEEAAAADSKQQQSANQEEKAKDAIEEEEKKEGEKTLPKSHEPLSVTFKPTEQVKKIPLKFWGAFTARLKKAWSVFTSDTDNIAGIFFATILLCETVDRYVEKKTEQYFTIYKTGKEYMAAKRRQKEEAYEKKAEATQIQEQEQQIKAPENPNVEALERFRHRPTRAAAVAAVNNTRYIEEEQSPDKSSTDSESMVGRLRKRIRRPPRHTEIQYPQKTRVDEKAAKIKQEKLEELSNRRRSTRLINQERKKYDNLNEEQWYTECKTCGKGEGNFVACSMCSASYHRECLGLDSTAEYDSWVCEPCLEKLVMQRQTRSSRRLQL